MLYLLVLLPFLLSIAFDVSATSLLVNHSPITLPISRRLNLTSVHNLLRHDQTRAKALKSKGTSKAVGIPFNNDDVFNEQIDNQAVVYVASVGVGSPATTYSLIVDTGSSNTWLGAKKAYVRTGTSTQTSNKVSVTYGAGSFAGNEFTDTVTISPGLVIPKQSMGVASTTTGFQNVDGILGLGPVGLTLGTLSPATGTLIPTVTDNLFSAGVITANQIGISFQPTSTDDSLNGEITWGGVDKTKFIIDGTSSILTAITFIPITKTSPANQFWGIDQSIKYGSTTILSTTAGIVDTGTTLVLIATDGFTKYKTATGGITDANTGLLRFTSAQFSNFQSLTFITGGVAFTLTPNAQIWPRSLNADIGGASSSIYGIVADLGSTSGQGFDFINGMAFLERFYSVYDTANRRVGLARTQFTTAATN